MKMYRQGDVLLVETSKVAYDKKIHGKIDPENDRVVLMHGEATGHHHSFKNSPNLVHFKPLGKKMGANQVSILEVKEDSALEHQEHDTIIVEKGTYRVLRQREYRPGAVPVRVRD